MKIAIIGGGISGLATAYELVKKGVDVTLYERTGFLGGQAASFDFDGINIEHFYHFICGADTELFDLIDELGIKKRLHWEPTKTAFYYEGELYPFSKPIDLVNFKPINIIDRIRYGLHILYSKYNTQWEKYDDVSAVSWLKKSIGEKAYNVLWHPLLNIKFGSQYDKISAAWLWHRIHRVASSRESLFANESMGYLDGGSQLLCDALENAIKEKSGKIVLKSKVDQILIHNNSVTGVRVHGQDHQYDTVISAVPFPFLKSILPPAMKNLKDKLERIDYIGVVCMLLKLKHPITDNFWLNINDSNISFNGIIEYTNLNKSKRFRDVSLAYIPFYLSTNDERYKYTNDRLFKEYCCAIKKINPEFDSDWIINYRVFRHRYAQPICTTNFSKLMVGPSSAEYRNLYLIDTSQLYPMDRCLSGMIGLANKTVQNIHCLWEKSNDLS